MELEDYHQLGLFMINRINQSRPPTETEVTDYLRAVVTSRVKGIHPNDDFSLSHRTWNEHRREALSYWKSLNVDFSKLPRAKVDKKRADACTKENLSVFYTFLRVLLQRSPTIMEDNGARIINLDEVGAVNILLDSTNCDLSMLSFSNTD